MIQSGSKASPLLILILLLVVPSCTAFHTLIGAEPRFVDTTIKQAQTHLASGDYRKALEVYADAYRHYPRNAALRAGYIRAGEQIRIIGETAFQRKDFVEAGSACVILLKSSILEKDFAEELSFGRERLNQQIQACSKGLLEAGLVQYRDGNLDEAISTWRKVAAFDPDNKEVKNAIEKAAIQLQNLKNMK